MEVPLLHEHRIIEIFCFCSYCNNWVISNVKPSTVSILKISSCDMHFASSIKHHEALMLSLDEFTGLAMILEIGDEKYATAGIFIPEKKQNFERCSSAIYNLRGVSDERAVRLLQISRIFSGMRWGLKVQWFCQLSRMDLISAIRISFSVAWSSYLVDTSLPKILRTRRRMPRAILSALS